MAPEYVFGLASSKDADEILLLYHSLIGTPGCTWHMDYPAMENIRDDISAASLYCLRDESGRIVAVAAAGKSDELEHDHIPWDAHMKNPCDLARIGTLPTLQRKGLGTLLMMHILQDVQKRGFDSIRMLVSKTNPAALKLYDKMGFTCCGETYKYDIDFFCYELVLNH
jgi:ribosomal protein S18 acetylase RimI-like enzyme